MHYDKIKYFAYSFAIKLIIGLTFCLVIFRWSTKKITTPLRELKEHVESVGIEGVEVVSETVEES